MSMCLRDGTKIIFRDAGHERRNGAKLFRSMRDLFEGASGMVAAVAITTKMKAATATKLIRKSNLSEVCRVWGNVQLEEYMRGSSRKAGITPPPHLNHFCKVFEALYLTIHKARPACPHCLQWACGYSKVVRQWLSLCVGVTESEWKVLYGNIGLSIHSCRKEQVLKDMLSWFHWAAALRNHCTCQATSSFRLTDERRIWYEWHAKAFLAILTPSIVASREVDWGPLFVCNCPVSYQKSSSLSERAKRSSMLTGRAMCHLTVRVVTFKFLLE
ncbi:hypothetical protein JOM56_009148 [Amanita muscaria]